MNDSLAWYNLVFYISLAIGVLLVAGVMVGGADLHHGIDLDGDGAPDVHDTDSQNSVLSLLGFGRVPVLIILMTMALTFGGTGVVCNMFLAPLLRLTSLFVVLSITGAFIVMVISTRVISHLVARWMPTSVTKSFTKYDLVGSSGTLLLDADDTSGIGQVVKDGDVYQVECRAKPSIPKGTKVLLIDFHESTNSFTVERDPSIS